MSARAESSSTGCAACSKHIVHWEPERRHESSAGTHFKMECNSRMLPRCLRRNTENSQLNAHRNTSRRERAKEVRLKGAEAITLRAGYSGTAPFCTQGQAGLDGKRCTVCSCSRRCAAGSAGKTKDQQAPFLPTHGGSGVVGSHANGHSHHVGQRRSQALDLSIEQRRGGKRGCMSTPCQRAVRPATKPAHHCAKRHGGQRLPSRGANDAARTTEEENMPAMAEAIYCTSRVHLPVQASTL